MLIQLFTDDDNEVVADGLYGEELHIPSTKLRAIGDPFNLDFNADEDRVRNVILHELDCLVRFNSSTEIRSANAYRLGKRESRLGAGGQTVPGHFFVPVQLYKVDQNYLDHRYEAGDPAGD